MMQRNRGRSNQAPSTITRFDIKTEQNVVERNRALRKIVVSQEMHRESSAYADKMHMRRKQLGAAARRELREMRKETKRAMKRAAW